MIFKLICSTSLQFCIEYGASNQEEKENYMKQYRVGILGATGAVGKEILTLLQESDFPISDLRLLASKRSVGKSVVFKDYTYLIQEVNENQMKDLDILFITASKQLSKQYAPIAAKQGALVIDNSSAYRYDDDVPLIIPEVNPKDILSHRGIIANPNCSTIIALTAIHALHKEAILTGMIVSTYQAVSGAGSHGIYELESQIDQIRQEEPVEIKTFPYQIAYNVIPQIGDFDDMGYSEEEMKMQKEARKMLHLPELAINCTCVRVPVFRSHSESITMRFEKDITPAKAKHILSQTPGVVLMDEPYKRVYPTPIIAQNQNDVFVGRIRKDLSSNDDKSLSLWCCGDQLRKGAATNAVQIAWLAIKEDVVKKDKL